MNSHNDCEDEKKWFIEQENIWRKKLSFGQSVPRKAFGSADCDALYTIYLSFCTQPADPNAFRGRSV